MGINMQRNKQTWNITDLTNYSNIKDASTFGSALQQIDNKLNDIKKEITYWDVYNISTAVYSEEEFENKVANLNVNSSLVINTTSFNATFNGKDTDFHSGDIIIRLKDGSDQHIKAANAGVYVPTITDNSGEETDENTTNLKITYNYVKTITDDQKEIPATIKSLSGDNSKMYGYSIPGTHNSKANKFPFSIIYQNKEDENGNIVSDRDNPIVPVLKFFDANNQEVYTDEYTLIKGQTGDTDGFTDSSKYYFYLRNNSSGLIQKVVIK